MHDITATMFNKRFMEELFKPQELYSKKAMRTVFDRLAHASIMRLNAASMDKVSRLHSSRPLAPIYIHLRSFYVSVFPYVCLQAAVVRGFSLTILFDLMCESSLCQEFVCAWNLICLHYLAVFSDAQIIPFPCVCRVYALST